MNKQIPKTETEFHLAANRIESELIELMNNDPACSGVSVYALSHILFNKVTETLETLGCDTDPDVVLKNIINKDEQIKADALFAAKFLGLRVGLIELAAVFKKGVLNGSN